MISFFTVGREVRRRPARRSYGTLKSTRANIARQASRVPIVRSTRVMMISTVRRHDRASPISARSLLMIVSRRRRREVDVEPSCNACNQNQSAATRRTSATTQSRIESKSDLSFIGTSLWGMQTVLDDLKVAIRYLSTRIEVWVKTYKQNPRFANTN